ncbi:serine threonine- kinase endoribonuclease ire-1-like isoform X1, partial [Paramuricea clavata]
MGTSVHVGIMEDGSEVAVKRILLQSSEEAAENEKKILSLIETKKSPFIVSYRNFLKDATFMYLIVDLCEETLKEHVESKTIEHLRQYGPRMIKEILRGLEFLHDQGILHRDLKPLNVLVDIEGHMRLADFGISRVLNEDETTVQTDGKGTEGWMPVEVIESRNQRKKGRFKKKSDVQVAGMIAFYILTKGVHPFGSALYNRMMNILNGNPVNLGILNKDLEAKMFVHLLIRHNITDRPYAFEALAHSFMVQ